MGCYGGGGAIFTNDEKLDKLLRSIVAHGDGKQRYYNERIGFNSRLDSMQAAILIEKLKIFPKEIALRNNWATHYNKILSDTFATPKIANNYQSVWAQYTLKADNRAGWQQFFKDNQIPTAVYYPIPIHQQQGYKQFLKVSSGLAVTEKLADMVFSLPMHPYLTAEYFEKLQMIIRSR